MHTLPRTYGDTKKVDMLRLAGKPSEAAKGFRAGRFFDKHALE